MENVSVYSVHGGQEHKNLALSQLLRDSDHYVYCGDPSEKLARKTSPNGLSTPCTMGSHNLKVAATGVLRILQRMSWDIRFNIYIAPAISRDVRFNIYIAPDM